MLGGTLADLFFVIFACFWPPVDVFEAMKTGALQNIVKNWSLYVLTQSGT